MFTQAYSIVMNSDNNALSKLPKIVRFQLMTYLAIMWSVIFCVWIGALTMIGPSIAAHSIILVGIFFTADVFRRSNNGSASDHRSKFKDPNDGCARYDDVWGG
ncbi:MAG: hypothetical protein CBB68_11595 [Rhodospirillaceae bacterium TMED8]|nr:hypothetical protein [Magnetovibrio sp.]OUT49636.1 MAG: hypothetical protein CBB68_11595 [Rhodospirillaceae bacterium TMED8]